MAKNKTTVTDVSVSEFVQKVENEVKRNDSFELIEIFRSVSGFEPKMWGPTIIGFGKYHYTYESGHSGEAPLAGFSPRKDAIVLYFSPEYENREQLIEKLGKHKSSKACIYIKKLADISLDVLKEMIDRSIQHTVALYPEK